MRALIVFHLGGFGGPQRSLVGASEWLSERGTVEFIVPEPGAVQAAYSRFGEVTVAPCYGALTYPRGPGQAAAGARRLGREIRFFRRELRARRPDVVVAVTTMLPALLVAARLEGARSVVYAAEDHSARRLSGRLLARFTALLGDGVVACSETAAAPYRAAGKPLRIAYPPIDPQPRPGDGGALRAQLGLEGARPLVAVVGSITRGRGQDVAVRALPSLLRSFPDARLLLVGSPHPRAVDLAYAEELPQLARALGVDGAVVQTPATAGIVDVLAAADVVVNPVVASEAFGRVAAEALVAGRPVVASRLGAIPEVVRDGVDGLLVPPGDPSALADAVCTLAGDRALAERLVASGRARVRERFGPEQDRAAWADVLARASRG